MKTNPGPFAGDEPYSYKNVKSISPATIAIIVSKNTTQKAL